jgi:hypothetical protein
MADILRLIWGAIADFFRSRADLQTEIIALRHQLNVLRRKRPERLVFGNTDRLLFVWLYTPEGFVHRGSQTRSS